VALLHKVVSYDTDYLHYYTVAIRYYWQGVVSWPAITDLKIHPGAANSPESRQFLGRVMDLMMMRGA